MINGSFVFGMDDDGRRRFPPHRRLGHRARHHHRDVSYSNALSGTQLYARMMREGRMFTRDWNLYDTRHVVYRPARLTPEALKAGYDWAYREFYRWTSIARASLHHGTLEASGQALLLCFGLEEVRAALGSDDLRAPAHPGYAVAGRSTFASYPPKDRRRRQSIISSRHCSQSRVKSYVVFVGNGPLPPLRLWQHHADCAPESTDILLHLARVNEYRRPRVVGHARWKKACGS